MAVKEALDDDWAGVSVYSENARSWLEEFEFNGFEFYDTWEWDCREYTAQFLWCCEAIPWGIAKYDDVVSDGKKEVAS